MNNDKDLRFEEVTLDRALAASGVMLLGLSLSDATTDADKRFLTRTAIKRLVAYLDGDEAAFNAAHAEGKDYLLRKIAASE